MSLVNKIGEIIKQYIIEKYNEYLKDESLLMIENENLSNIIGNMYNKNIKNLKIHIREQLKHDMGTEYPSGSIENILLDLFQDRDVNINRMVMEIEEYQKKNYYEIIVKLDKKGLGINLSIESGFCYINGLREDCLLPNMEKIENYRYLYSINGIVLRGNNDNIINIIRNNIDTENDLREVILSFYGFYN